jgi:protease YdgD
MSGRRWPTVALLAVLLAGLAAGASATDSVLRRQFLPGISEHDKRLPLMEPVSPWTAVGRVNTRIGGFCSGTLIAPDKVLTAAHCIWNGRMRQWLVPDALHFLAGYSRGDYLAHRKIVAIRLDPDINVDKKNRMHDPATDWAVLTLESPVPATRELTPIRLASQSQLAQLNKDAPLQQAGYSRDRAHMLTVVKGCHLVGFKHSAGGVLLLHDCDATFGDSGSPVLSEFDGELRIVGIHTAAIRRKQGDLGLAVRLPDELLR